MLALGQTPGDILAASRSVWLVVNAVFNFPPLLRVLRVVIVTPEKISDDLTSKVFFFLQIPYTNVTSGSSGERAADRGSDFKLRLVGARQRSSCSPCFIWSPASLLPSADDVAVARRPLPHRPSQIADKSQNSLEMGGRGVSILHQGPCTIGRRKA